MLYKNLYTFTRNQFNYEVHMRANAVILIVIGLLLLVGTAGAVIQVNVIVVILHGLLPEVVHLLPTQ